MSHAAHASATREEDDSRLREDTRYLGRLLGDTLREQEGEAIFRLVERIRQTAILFRRSRDWPMVQSLLSNMEMVLAKTDLGIAARYADLVRDGQLHERVFGRIHAEWKLTIRRLLEINGQPGLLAGSPALLRSIRQRFPYIDPLNHLQVSLLRRYRSGETDDKVKRGILISINGIAAGLRNSG